MCFTSVIIFQIHVNYFAIGKTKSNPPVSGDTNAPQTFSISGELVKPVAGKIHIIQTFGLVEYQQNSFDAISDVRSDTASVSLLI